MDETKIKTFNNRIYRNKRKILHHKIYIVMAIVLLSFLALYQSDLIQNNFTFIMILFGLLIGSDILMIGYHRWWINKWRKELTEMTGRDYDKLDEITNEYINEADFEKFVGKYISDEDFIHFNNFVVNGEKPTFPQKLYFFAMNGLLRNYCENQGILNTYKMQDLPYLKSFCKKYAKKVVKRK